MITNEEDFSTVWEQIVAQAWSNNDFKQRMLAQAGSVFGEFGISVSPGGNVNVVENTGTDKTMVLPMPLSSTFSEIGSSDTDMWPPCWTL